MGRDSRERKRRRQGGAHGDDGASAILFDFNGVLLEDEGLHFRCYLEILRPAGIAFGRDQYEARYLPYDDRAAVARMLRDAGRPAPPALVRRIVAAKRRLYRAKFPSEGMAIDRRARALVRRLALRRPLVIVSGAARCEILAALAAARLRRAFRFIIASENVRRGKPHPEGYRGALRRLGKRAGRRPFAIEDSPGGIRAARAAGLPVLAVATSYRPSVLRRAGAYAVIPTLATPGRHLRSSRRRTARRPGSL
jgi:beta-phosphoglucomutase